MCRWLINQIINRESGIKMEVKAFCEQAIDDLKIDDQFVFCMGILNDQELDCTRGKPDFKKYMDSGSLDRDLFDKKFAEMCPSQETPSSRAERYFKGITPNPYTEFRDICRNNPSTREYYPDSCERILANEFGIKDIKTACGDKTEFGKELNLPQIKQLCVKVTQG